MTDVLAVQYGNILKCTNQIANVTIELYRQFVRQVELEGGLFESRTKYPEFVRRFVSQLHEQ